MAKKEIDIILRARDLASGTMRKAGRATDAFRSSLHGLQRMIGPVNMALGGLGAGVVFSKAIKDASEAQETMSKFEAVFKDQSEAASRFAENIADSLGRSEMQAHAFMAQLQDTFVPLGYGREQARELSQQLVQLTYDLASFNNEAEGDVIGNLTSGLVGNHEAWRRWGVIVTQQTLNAELMRMGIEGGTRAASEQEKVMARLNLLMGSTKDAQGDAARTADSFANQMRRAKAEMEELSIQLGRSLLPAFTDLLGRTSDTLNRLEQIISIQHQAGNLPGQSGPGGQVSWGQMAGTAASGFAAYQGVSMLGRAALAGQYNSMIGPWVARGLGGGIAASATGTAVGTLATVGLVAATFWAGKEAGELIGGIRSISDNVAKITSKVPGVGLDQQAFANYLKSLNEEMKAYRQQAKQQAQVVRAGREPSRSTLEGQKTLEARRLSQQELEFRLDLARQAQQMAGGSNSVIQAQIDRYARELARRQFQEQAPEAIGQGIMALGNFTAQTLSQWEEQGRRALEAAQAMADTNRRRVATAQAAEAMEEAELAILQERAMHGDQKAQMELENIRIEERFTEIRRKLLKAMEEQYLTVERRHELQSMLADLDRQEAQSKQSSARSLMGSRISEGIVPTLVNDRYRAFAETGENPQAKTARNTQRIADRMEENTQALKMVAEMLRNNGGEMGSLNLLGLGGTQF